MFSKMLDSFGQDISNRIAQWPQLILTLQLSNKYAIVFQLVKRLRFKYIGKKNDGEIKFGLTLTKNTFAFYDR